MIVINNMYFVFAFVLLVLGLDCGKPHMIAMAMTSSSSSHPLNQYAHIDRIRASAIGRDRICTAFL
eukprot:scaffold210_cov75-Skeletonema_dohrnii-CCMP3373.AAC.2